MFYPIYSQHPAHVGVEESSRECSVQTSAVSLHENPVFLSIYAFV